MEDKLFNELVESIREMGAHLRGEIDLPPERIHFVGEPDPREIRARLGMTQEEFAAALCISVKTLRNWEQGRRKPEGPARALLRVAAVHPEAVLDALARPADRMEDPPVSSSPAAAPSAPET